MNRKICSFSCTCNPKPKGISGSCEDRPSHLHRNSNEKNTVWDIYENYNSDDSTENDYFCMQLRNTMGIPKSFIDKRLEHNASWRKYQLNPPRVACQQEEGIKWWYLPQDFSQKFFNGRILSDGRMISNACTIICLLMATNVCAYRLIGCIEKDEVYLSFEVLQRYLTSMVTANMLHSYLMETNQITILNLTVPEALRHCQTLGELIKEWYFVHENSAQRIAAQIVNGIEESVWGFQYDPPQDKVGELFFAVFIMDKKSALFVINLENGGTITVFDSHSPHGGSGGLVGHTQLYNLSEMVNGYLKITKKRRGGAFELSFLYFISESEI